MSQRKGGLETWAGILRARSTAVAAFLWLVAPSLLPASPRLAEADARALEAITVSFKLDPRLSGGTYGGEHWASPATFTSAAQEGDEATVDARVQGVDAAGKPMAVVPEWTAANPEMVSVTPGRNGEFRISVKRTGESTLMVASQGRSVDLAIRARSLGRSIQVEITRQRPARSAARMHAPEGDAASGSILPDQKAKKSYAFGVEVGNGLKRDSLGLDGELVARGLRDALSGSTLMTDAELKTALSTLRNELRARHAVAAQQREETNKKEGEAFLAENMKQDGVVTLPSGLQYKVLRAGEGKKPTDADIVECRYQGTRIDGTEFNGSSGGPATFPVTKVIPGWREAIKLMPVGSKWQIFVPSHLAYGEKGMRSRKGSTEIGPNTTLIFEVELVSIRDKPQTQAAQTTP